MKTGLSNGNGNGRVNLTKGRGTKGIDNVVDGPLTVENVESKQAFAVLVRSCCRPAGDSLTSHGTCAVGLSAEQNEEKIRRDLPPRHGSDA